MSPSPPRTPPPGALQALSDEELMVLVQRDDRAAYETLYTRWSRPLFRFLGRRTGALQQAEEAHQETWLRVYRWRRRYDPQRPFRPWIYTLAANAGRDAMRPQPALFRLPAQRGGTQAARDALVSALHGLGPTDRKIMLLAAEGFKTAEVAQMVSLKPAAVRKRISRARRRIRERTHAENA